SGMSSSDTISAADLAARVMGVPAPKPSRSSRNVIRRVIGGHRTSTMAETITHENPQIDKSGASMDMSPDTNPTRFTSLNSTHLLDQFDHLVELLEERIITELERRGG